MTRQRATVLVFKPGVPIDQIELALTMLSCLLDENNNEPGRKTPRVEKFNPADGTPTFYIP